MFKNLFKAVFIITFFSILTRIIGFFIRIFMSRTLGAEIIGIYQIACSIVGVFLTIVSSGIPLSISRFSAQYLAEKNYTKSSKMITSGTIISVGLAVIICILALIFKPIIINLSANALVSSVLIALLPTVIATSLNVGFKGYLWGAQKHFENCLVDFIEQIIKFALIIILVSKSSSIEQGIVNCALSVSIACVIATTISMLFYFKNKGRFSNPTGYFKPLLKKSTPITLLRIASSLGGMFISFIMPYNLVKVGFSSEQAISLFGIALGMTLPLLYLPNTLVGSLCTALIPDLAKLKVENKMQEFSSKVKTSFVFSVFISLFLVPCFSSVGKEIGMFVYNNELSGIMLQYSALIMLPMGINDIASSVLNSLGYEVKSFKNYIFGSIFLMLSIFLLPKYFGIYSLLIGMAGSLTISGCLNIKMIKNELGIKKIIMKEMFLMCLFLVPSSLINEFVFNILSNFFTTFFSIAISSIMGAIFFMLLCLIFRIFTLNALMINFKNIRILKKKRKSQKNIT